VTLPAQAARSAESGKSGKPGGGHRAHNDRGSLGADFRSKRSTIIASKISARYKFGYIRIPACGWPGAWRLRPARLRFAPRPADPLVEKVPDPHPFLARSTFLTR
jgi:hypothetical protein